MRRFLTIVAVTAVIALCSCGNKKADAELDAKVAEFEQTCDKIIELYGQIEEGDLSVAEEMEATSVKMQQQANELAEHASELTPAQSERIEEAAKEVENALLP